MGWLLSHIVGYLKEAGIWLINQLIASIGSLISYIVSLLPNMPTLPTLPSNYDAWLSYGGYWFPVGYLLTLGASLLVLWGLFEVLAIPLRWAKAIRGSQ